jgi:hypothetical protein
MSSNNGPMSFTFNDKEVYLAEELRDYDPTFFIGCTKTVRNIIKRKNIPDDDYYFGIKLKNVWHVREQSYKSAKLMISKEWVEKFMIKSKEPKEVIPDILELNDNEKFKDADGKIINIEVRGERNRKNCYFKVSDISKGFEMPNIKKIITGDDANYKSNKHYKYFNIIIGNNLSINTIKKTLYLTYSGFIRMLFVSRNKNAEVFHDWAEEKLFTIQFGKIEQKEELASELLSVDIKAIREVFNKSSISVPCVYLFSLGKVKDLRDTFNISQDIDDESIVYKYGMTKDMDRRIKEHIADYGKMKNVEFKLELYSYIDVQYISNAEQDIRNLFNGLDMNLEVPGRSELVVIKKKHYNVVKTQYITINNMYAGHTKELQKKIEELKHTIEKLNDKLKYEKEKIEDQIKIQKLEYENIIQKEKYEKESYKEKFESSKIIFDLTIKNYELRK